MTPEQVAHAAAHLVHIERIVSSGAGNRSRADTIGVIGAAIREARRARKLRQSELAKMAGVGIRAVNEVENDRRPHISATSLLRLASAAGVRLVIETADRPTAP